MSRTRRPAPGAERLRSSGCAHRARNDAADHLHHRTRRDGDAARESAQRVRLPAQAVRLQRPGRPRPPAPSLQVARQRVMARLVSSRRRAWALWCFFPCGLSARTAVVEAQGPTSAAITGRILDDSGRGMPGVEVFVTNQATGISMRGVSRAEGRYLLSGLEVGGPYAVMARRIGYPMTSRTGLVLTLGQQLDVDIALATQPSVLPRVETRALNSRVFSRAHMGTETFLSDSLIHQMPVVNRDLY